MKSMNVLHFSARSFFSQCALQVIEACGQFANLNGRAGETGCRGVLTPKILELGRRKLGIADRMLDGLVPEVILNAARIVPRIGQRVAARVAQHVDVYREAK